MLAMPRLFVALRPPPAIRDSLFDTMDGVPDARWQDEEQVHLTLRFVGEVDAHQADDLAAALAAIHAEAPMVALSGVGRFERRGRTDTLWAGVVPRDALAHLHRKVDQACVRAGIEPDRRAYLPHVTLARLSRSHGAGPSIDRWLADHAGLTSAPFVLPYLILYESILGRAGARYEPVVRWPLGTSAALSGSP